jgi:hypothetical protein
MSDAARLVPRNKPPGKESRNQQFRRVATKRMQEAEARIDRVGALAIRRNAYTIDEAQAMIAGLRARVDAAEQRLIPPAFSFDARA